MTTVSIPTTDGGTVEIDPGDDKQYGYIIALMIAEMKRWADAQNTYRRVNYERRVQNWMLNHKRPEMPNFTPPLMVRHTYSGDPSDADTAFTKQVGPETLAPPFSWPPEPEPEPKPDLTLGIEIIPGLMWDDPTDSVEDGAHYTLTGKRVVGKHFLSPFSAGNITYVLERYNESEHGPWTGQ